MFHSFELSEVFYIMLPLKQPASLGIMIFNGRSWFPNEAQWDIIGNPMSLIETSSSRINRKSWFSIGFSNEAQWGLIGNPMSLIEASLTLAWDLNQPHWDLIGFPMRLNEASLEIRWASFRPHWKSSQKANAPPWISGKPSFSLIPNIFNNPNISKYSSA